MLIRHVLGPLLTVFLLTPLAVDAAKPVCGDGNCTGKETAELCPEDCDASSQLCGDGTCDSSESCSICPGDCGECPPPTCNNDGVCNLGEDCQSCPGDCSGKLDGKKSDRYCCGGQSELSLFCELSVCGPDCGTPGDSGPVCGDGVLDSGEACDDGNTVSGDGCSAVCQIEPPPSVCGNGIPEAGEECDDGNTTSGDGCDNICQIESSANATPVNQFNIGDSIGEGEAADGTISSINHETVWSTGYDASDTVSSLNERFEASDASGYYENTDNRDATFNHALSGAVMADFVDQAQNVVNVVGNTPSGMAGQISFLLGNNDVCADDMNSMTDIGQFEAQFRAGLEVLAGNEATRMATLHVSSLPAIYWLWESRADESLLSACRLLIWPFVPCQNLLASSADDCASLTSREDPDTIYPGDGPNCQRRKTFHARIRDDYNPVLRDVVQEYATRTELPLPNARYIDVFDVRFDKEHVNGGDCFHPSEAGHRLLSEKQYCRSAWSEGDTTCAQ